ncbi:MAG: TIGR04190 family B12-binding domain/radical SAM domain protein [candidate division Zixibacteria bacterium]|nr:TIGR04190 family B12-binding domain/radical SAM domain protein [candidate division Zixibacteria bacterium]
MYDIILIHPPSVYDFRKRSIMFGPISDVIPSTPVFDMYPLGFVSLSSYLTRKKIKVRILNLVVKMLSSPDYDVEKEIKNLKSLSFGIDLHWLPHAQGGLEIAKLLKKYHPETPVIFGGLSATYFHKELILYPEVNFVIRGDSAELPLFKLIQVLKGKEGLYSVPNLTYKDKRGEIRINSLNFIPENLNGEGLDYTHLIRSVLRDKDLLGYFPFYGWEKYPITAIFTCKGCTQNCTSCGGSAFAYANFCLRGEPAYRDPELVVKDMKKISLFFKGPIFLLGDLFQPGEAYAYRFLNLLKKVKIKNQVVLEFFNIPPLKFLYELGKSLPNFNIQISAESHDPQVRSGFKRNYDNNDLESFIENSLKAGCKKFDLFFMIGLPYQTYDSVMRTVYYCDYLLDKFNSPKRLYPFISPLAPFVDPGSMVFENPEKFGYQLLFRSLEDHRKALESPSWRYMLNYRTQWLSTEEIVYCTYEAASKLNYIKYRHNLLDEKTYLVIENRIRKAIEIMKKIDRAIAQGRSLDEKELEELKRKFDLINYTTLCEKGELKWPLRFFQGRIQRWGLKYALYAHNIINFLKRSFSRSTR